MRVRLFVLALAAVFCLTAGAAMAEEKDALYWYKKGNDCWWSLDKQVEYYTKAIELAPNWAYPYNNRGVAYFHLGDMEKSRADYSKAMELKPGYKLAQANRAGSNFNKKTAADEMWEGSYQDRLAAGF